MKGLINLMYAFVELLMELASLYLAWSRKVDLDRAGSTKIEDNYFMD